MSPARWLASAALTAAGGTLFWQFEPGMAWTDYGLGCAILAYVGAVALGVGVSVLTLDAVERAGNRLFQL